MLGQLLAGGFGNTKVDHFWNRFVIIERHDDIGWLYVAMDDPFLVGVLNRLAYWDEEFESLFWREFSCIAELGDRNTFDESTTK